MAKDIFDELYDIFDEVKDIDLTSYQRLPDGEYIGTIVECKVGESKKTGLPMVTIGFEITEGENKGFIHRQFLMLSGYDEDDLRKKLNRYATTVKKLGIDTSKGLKETFEQFDKAIGQEVKIEIKTTYAKKTGNPYTNTSFEVL